MSTHPPALGRPADDATCSAGEAAGRAANRVVGRSVEWRTHADTSFTPPTHAHAPSARRRPKGTPKQKSYMVLGVRAQLAATMTGHRLGGRRVRCRVQLVACRDLGSKLAVSCLYSLWDCSSQGACATGSQSPVVRCTRFGSVVRVRGVGGDASGSGVELAVCHGGSYRGGSYRGFSRTVSVTERQSLRRYGCEILCGGQRPLIPTETPTTRSETPTHGLPPHQTRPRLACAPRPHNVRTRRALCSRDWQCCCSASSCSCSSSSTPPGPRAA
jgi:hypothetical protein